jgi:NAD(P)-dependent dehydrogenase (short-subunit alcohol dehydrogenase family)
MELGLKGKVALVTGGSEGIGAATAKAFAREGACVAICARREEPLREVEAEIRSAGGECLAMTADVRRAEDVEKFVKAAHDRFGRVDILINNAGTSAASPFESVTDEAWAEDLDLKLFAAIRASRLAIPLIREQGGGAIINLTNIQAKQPAARSVPTSVSRAGGIALTKALSKEFAKDKIRVNTVCIGLVKSGQISRSAQRQHPDAPLDEAYERMGQNVPIGRLAEADEAADLIVFLCSDRAQYITGDAINFDGGTSAVV